MRLAVAASAAATPSPGALDPGELEALERCFSSSPDSGPPSVSSGASLGPVMKKDYGAFGAVTLEKSKLDLSQKTTRMSPEVIGGGCCAFGFISFLIGMDDFWCCIFVMRVVEV